FPSERNKLLELSYSSNNPDTQKTVGILESFGIRILSMDMDEGIGKGKKKGARLRIFVGIPGTTDIAKLAKALKTSGKVERIEMKEKY
ncbi:MAG: MgtC/SapB family protein, partial [Treponema sp.]|nr:MgtC/SapB family protein [Treponema sp.]